jgi:hypothetical protein
LYNPSKIAISPLRWDNVVAWYCDERYGNGTKVTGVMFLGDPLVLNDKLFGVFEISSTASITAF